MRVVIMTWAMLTVLTGIAAAETFTGSITSIFEGGANYQQMEIDGEWYVVGCGPDDSLEPDMLQYLEDRWDQTGTIEGELAEEEPWGKCVRNPQLVDGEAGDTAQDVPASSVLGENPWIRLSGSFPDDAKLALEITLTSDYWDGVLGDDFEPFLGVLRYFHERGFSVSVSHRVGNADPKADGCDSHPEFVFTFLNRPEDIGVVLQLGNFHDCPLVQDGLEKKMGARAVSVIYFGISNQTTTLHRDEWYRIADHDWAPIAVQMLKERYINEAE